MKDDSFVRSWLCLSICISKICNIPLFNNNLSVLPGLE